MRFYDYDSPDTYSKWIQEIKEQSLPKNCQHCKHAQEYYSQGEIWFYCEKTRKDFPDKPEDFKPIRECIFIKKYFKNIADNVKDEIRIVYYDIEKDKAEFVEAYLGDIAI